MSNASQNHIHTVNGTESSISYCERLAQVYIDLIPDRLVAPLPAWTTEDPNICLYVDPQLLAPNPAQKPQQQVLAEELQKIPRLQAALANVTAYTPSKWLLEQELSRRKANGTGNRPSWDAAAETDVYDAAAEQGLRGLCFSGGGIRSATFCLGVLQALAEANKLKTFDYLSTVSGGGYIHQWFASWIRNEPGHLDKVEKLLKPLPTPGSGARAPEQITWLRRYSSYLTPQRGIFSVDTWTMIALWFRNTFLNQIVLFSFLILCLLVARSITFFFIFYRRGPVMLNRGALSWVIGIAIIVAAGIFLGYLYRALASQSEHSTPFKPNRNALDDPGVVGLIVLPTFLLALFVALQAMGGVELPPLLGQSTSLLCALVVYAFLTFTITFGGGAPATYWQLTEPCLKDSDKPGPVWGFRAAVSVAALLCALAAFGLARYTYDASGPPPSTPAYARQAAPPPEGYPSRPSRLYNVAQRIADFLTNHMSTPAPATKLHQVVSSDAHPLATLDVELSTSPRLVRPLHPVTPQAIFAVFAPVVFFALQFLAVRLQLGLIGRYYTEERREWLSRLGGWSAIVSLLWIALSGIGLFGPILYYWLFTTTTLHRVGGIAATLAVHAVTLFSGASSKSSGKPKSSGFLGFSALDLVGMVGAPICILILLVLCSGLIDVSIDTICAALDARCLSHYWILLPVLGIAVLFAIFAARVDVNEFSMHGFYRNRLARCYLGATNPLRSPDPFTGFDEHTEATTQTGMRLSELLPVRFGGQAEDETKIYDGPFPIFCATLNLSFGEDLAWQERKGASFAFTPLYSGYHVGWTAAKGQDQATTFNGFVPTREYAYQQKGIHLATVAAISGAALNPNMGYNTQPALSFLMTLFNVRLGWWLANPRKPAIWPADQRKPTPRLGLGALLSELFGLTDDRSKYVCLSDGGHFENLGLYELVRRRCRFIVICDAGADDGPTFEAIGLAIAKCRTDFGVEIDLNLEDLTPNPDAKGYNEGCSRAHFVPGTIRYPRPPVKPKSASSDKPEDSEPKDDGKQYEGVILFLKTSITGKETADILHHRLAFPDFPQDTTLNQWFSESQFESYRRLGQQIGKEAAPLV
jgi:MFS family permease